LDKNIARVSIGLALQSAIIHDREVEALLALYTEPNLDETKRLHDRLVVSLSHFDREIAIWLEPLLACGQLNFDPKKLAKEMNEMEFLLYNLIYRAGDAQQEVNNWMNCIANAAESLADGFWIDAKILLSQALELSRSASVEHLKSHCDFSHQLDILQRATEEYFEEMKKYPLTLVIPEGRLETILRVQKTMLDLMKGRDRTRQREDEAIGIVIRRLNTAIRFLMNESKEVNAACQELQLAYDHLDEIKSKTAEEAKRELRECSGSIEELEKTKAPRALEVRGLKPSILGG